MSSLSLHSSVVWVAPPTASILHLAFGSVFRGHFTTIPVDWSSVHQRAEALSSAHTQASGHRLVDLLHVATALHLGVTEFLTFDGNQKALAEAEGLVVPV
jgi:predicted nucleic acid-binding protein